MDNALALSSLRSGMGIPPASGDDWREGLGTLAREHKKAVLYGCGPAGRLVGRLLLQEGVDFYGFCGRSAALYPDGLMGKPVLSPEQLFAGTEEYYVVIAANNKNNRAISELLREHRFPEDRILPYFYQLRYVETPDIYFEFPELIPKNGALIDGGCYDGDDSLNFARYTGGDYSQIFAIEPDAGSFARCSRRLADAGLRDVELVQAALSDRTGTAFFTMSGRVDSHIVEARGGYAEVPTVMIDSLAEGQTVAMIKMDIEGAEWAALHGAAATLKRDRPFLAISVYHRRGDMPAIMEYCRGLVPEYRFWLRQYHGMTFDTVLYASAAG